MQNFSNQESNNINQLNMVKYLWNSFIAFFQSTPSEQTLDDGEWNSQEREQVFLRYNIYNTPLAPIPEENSNDDNSDSETPK